MRTSLATIRRVNLARDEVGEYRIHRPREIPSETFRVVVAAPESIFNGREGAVLCERYFGEGASDLFVEVEGRDGAHRLGFLASELVVMP